MSEEPMPDFAEDEATISHDEIEDDEPATEDARLTPDPPDDEPA